MTLALQTRLMFNTRRLPPAVVMRYLFAIISLGVACCSITLGRAHPAANSWACRAGLCQIDAVIGSETSASQPASPASFVSRLNETPSDPYLWSDYADSLDANGDGEKAAEAFDHAVSLGPSLPSVLLRAAYFAFTHDRFDRGAALSNRILSETSSFDSLVFFYLHYFGQGKTAAMESGIPASARPAHAWAAWIAANGSEAEITDTSWWLRRNRLIDQPTAQQLTWTLWQRQFFGSARDVWSDWAGAEGQNNTRLGVADGQLLANPRFENRPDGSPFDWTIPTLRAVQISRDNGLTIRFSGTANIKLDGIQQSLVVTPGRYHFAAIIESDGLTTDQRPSFRIFDPANQTQLNVELPISATVEKSEMGRDFVVPAGSSALTIELQRRPSSRFDNKIQGTLHVYEISLAWLSGTGGPGRDHLSAIAKR